MKPFLIFSTLTVLALSLPAQSFAQNKGIMGGNPGQTKQSAQPAVAVINAPVQAPAAASTPAPPPSVVCTTVAATTEYTVGIDDVVDVHVLKPEVLYISATVAPDGTIVLPYIGSVRVKGQTIAQIQDEIQSRLADGYMKYPVVSVSLGESNSRRFFVYGEVIRPGAYYMEENMTILRAISMAGGFSQFGSASRVKILRPKIGSGGYDVIKVNIADVMNGVAGADPAISQGDIIVVSEGIF